MDAVTAKGRIESWVAVEMGQPVTPAVLSVADEIRRRHGDTAAAVLFYGSCLRQGREDGVLDFYLLVDRYRDAYGRWLPSLANTLVPPNVFYLETAVDDRVLRAKYAVVTLKQFARGTSPRSFHSSLWARFAQPVRLVHARDAAARTAVIEAVSTAIVTMVGRVVPLLDRSFGAAELWTRGFQETYRAELRTEGPDRAGQIYDGDRDRYERLTPWALTANGYGWEPGPNGIGFLLSAELTARQKRRFRRLWRIRQSVGKLLTVLRLAKGIFTFEGGMDYILWKIERHSGVRATATPWQRRHPLLASPLLAWRLYRKGAFR